MWRWAQPCVASYGYCSNYAFDFIFSKIGIIMSNRGLFAASSFMHILIIRDMWCEIPGGILMRRPSNATWQTATCKSNKLEYTQTDAYNTKLINIIRTRLLSLHSLREHSWIHYSLQICHCVLWTGQKSASTDYSHVWLVVLWAHLRATHDDGSAAATDGWLSWLEEHGEWYMHKAS